jgi:hypothetical protein
MLHSRKELGKKDRSVSTAETVGLACCSTALILNATGLVSNIEMVNYSLRGYCLLDSLFYLMDGTYNLIGWNLPVLCPIQGFLGTFGLMVGISLGKGITTDAHGVCNWTGAKDFIDMIMSLALESVSSTPRIQAASILKDLLTACAWLILGNYGLTNLAGCILMVAATLVSLKESYQIGLFSPLASQQVNARQQNDAQQILVIIEPNNRNSGAAPLVPSAFNAFSGTGYRLDRS